MKKVFNLKSVLVFLIVMTLSATMFLGCGSSKKAENSNEKVTLQFWTISLKPTFNNYFNGIIDKYEQSHQNVKIEWTDLPFDSIQNKLVTAIAGDTAPDVVNLSVEMALSLQSKNALVNLDKEATKTQRDIYIPSLYNATKTKTGSYSFPWYGAPNIMMYNKALFEKAGLTNAPKTFDEMFEMAKTMKEKTGAYLYIPDNISNILMLDGIKLVSDDHKKAAFNTPEAIALIQKYKDAAKAGYIPKENWSKWDPQLQQFSTGKLAILNSGAQSIKRIKDEAPDIYKTMDVTTPMVGKTKKIANAVMNLVVPKASKHHKEAIDFASYVTNDENQLGFSKAAHVFPSTNKASQDAFFKSDTTSLEGKAISEVADELKDTVQLSIGLGNEQDIYNIINKIADASILGNTDIKAAFDDAEKQVNILLSQSKGN